MQKKRKDSGAKILTFKKFVIVDSFYTACVHAQGSDLNFLQKKRDICDTHDQKATQSDVIKKRN